MMDVKETLKRLHKKFPNKTLDEILDILDCYVETPIYNTKDFWTNDRLYTDRIYYNDSKTNEKYGTTTTSTTYSSENCEPSYRICTNPQSN
jgi:hypothetical protein